jgi:diacylglycerol kinase
MKAIFPVRGEKRVPPTLKSPHFLRRLRPNKRFRLLGVTLPLIATVCYLYIKRVMEIFISHARETETLLWLLSITIVVFLLCLVTGVETSIKSTPRKKLEIRRKVKKLGGFASLVLESIKYCVLIHCYPLSYFLECMINSSDILTKILPSTGRVMPCIDLGI